MAELNVCCQISGSNQSNNTCCNPMKNPSYSEETTYKD